MDEQAALEDIKNGGQSGYTALYKQYVKSLRYYLIAKYNIPENSVEDELQKIFIKFFDSIPSFKQNCSVSTWLYIITKNVANDYWRKKKSEGVAIPIDVPDEETGGSDLIDILLEPLLMESWKKEQNDFDIQRCLERALARLERDGSKASLLNCLKTLTLQARDASIEEMSKKIERTPVATRRYLSDCRKKLKQYQPIQQCWE